MSDPSAHHEPDRPPHEQHSPPDAQPLSVERPGDALALVKHTFGHLPKDSLVIIGLSAGTTGGHLRVDLAPVLREPERLGAQCAEWIAGPAAAPAPEAAMALIFDSEIPDPDCPDQYEILMAALARGLLEQAGASLVKVWHVGHGYIRDFQSCDVDERESFPGEDADSALSNTLQRIPALVSTRASSPLEALRDFLAPNPLVTEDQQGRVCGHQAPPPRRSEAVTALWEAALRRCLREAPADRRADAGWVHRSPEQTAALVRTLEHPEHVEILMALTVTGIDTLEDLLTRGDSDLGTVALTDAVWGLSCEPPRWERVESLVALLRHLLPYAADAQRAQILGLRSWVEWLRGSGSTASVFADAVREQYPDLWRSTAAPPVARSVLACISTLGVCPWAQVKESSYSWWSGSR
ncbi:DUF4192 family protein [Nesterenkonia natronophila]|uniref:DUF4192 family protein n=1 Tax=Nesterenkonia natronophila TaxID=2174932 RepID=A0A3A4FZ50_9MICC|nr:DUF4192 family protein [Nesterenkonia natronophila]RJN31269.1 DUF4192 family protein [Nesterenkonia natronophila]